MFTIQLINMRYNVPANWIIEPSRTENHILLFIFDGGIDYRFEGEAMPLYKNDLVFIPLGRLRSASPCPPHYHKMYSVHFQLNGPTELPLALLDRKSVV